MTTQIVRDHNCRHCRKSWTAEVTFSTVTTNSSGEATTWCPLCGGKNVSSSPQYTIQIVETETEEEDEAPFSWSECGVLDYNFYGLTIVSLGGREYAVGDDSQADDAAKEYIRSSVWAFNPDFLSNHTNLDADIIRIIQEANCEDANEPLLRFIDNFNEFVADAVGTDGRGHFISSYDGEENTLDSIDSDDAKEIAKVLEIDEDDWSSTYIYRLQ